MRVAVCFLNGVGNFIFLTAAIKVLKRWGYEVDLITDEKFLKHPALMEISDGIFGRIRTKYVEDGYKKVFIFNWSVPAAVRRKVKTINWQEQGIHEVQHYLDCIGASWDDFDGYIFKPDLKPKIRKKDFTIALANCSRTNQAVKKRWDKFPELSEVLQDLGYQVVLLGLDGELEGCKGIDYTGKLTLRQTAKVLQQCNLLISPSTGLSVVADAVGTSVLLLEGPMTTPKSHPLLVNYAVVRKYVACAPCFQKSTWWMCKKPVCMTRIEVGDVIQKMLNFIPKMYRPRRKVFVKKEKAVKGRKFKCDGKVAYCVACFNRYHLLKSFLKSFKESEPQEGHVLFLNDGSTDPRVKKALLDFKVDGIEVHYFEADQAAQRHRCRCPSCASYNFLLKKAEKIEDVDYLAVCDPDAIFKPFWAQRMILTLEYARRHHEGVGLCSCFNAKHPVYDVAESQQVFSSPYGQYRLKRGVNLLFLMRKDFFKNDFGLFDVEENSADLSKNAELAQKGFWSVVLQPSMAQHMGAFASSFVRLKRCLFAEDF